MYKEIQISYSSTALLNNIDDSIAELVMMKMYKLSQPQKILGGALLAITAGVSVLIGLSHQELSAQMAVRENVLVTREVELQLSASAKKIAQENIKAVELQTIVKTDPTLASQTTSVTSWKMGGIKTSTPAIPLSEKISSYAIVELEQNPKTFPTAGQQIVVPMLNGQTVVANVESVVTHPNGDYSWSGHLEGHGNDYPVVMTYGERSIFATITTPEGSYTMESLDGSGWLYKNPAEIELSAPGAKDFLDVDTTQ